MPVAPKSFTDRGVKSLLSLPGQTQTDWFDPDRQPAGFAVRVSLNGTRSWTFFYRYNGVKRRMKLGAVREIGLRAARDAAWDAHEKARKGGDPATDRQKAKARVQTVKELAGAYLAEYAKKRKSSWKKDEQILNREVIPFIGRMRATDVTRAQIRDEVLQRIVDRGAPVRANHTLEIVRKMFNWAIQAKDFTFNPAALLEKPGGARPPRDRYLSSTELPRFWASLDQRNSASGRNGGQLALGERGSIAFKLLLLTAQREMELLRARWRDVDLDEGVWTIPKNIAKNRIEQIVPLTPYIMGLFRRLRVLADPADEFVFQSPHTGSHMRRVFYEKRIIKIRKAAALEDFTIHDLRRTATTYWGRIRVGEGEGRPISREIKKRLLNHAVADVTAVYDRFEYLDEKREALTKWQELLLKFAGDADPGQPSAGNVVHLQATA